MLSIEVVKKLNAYADAVVTYLAFALDKTADYWSSFCSWFLMALYAVLSVVKQFLWFGITQNVTLLANQQEIGLLV